VPRRPRTDSPGSIHHVFARGIERRDLFLDDEDRRIYLTRLCSVLPEEGARVLAWAIQSNHVHLLVRTGDHPLSRVMQRVGTAYGRYFNQRHGREGYVFQGRYGARWVGDDGYLRRLIQYVHRNPISAGVVGSVDDLAFYPWTGHAALMGRSAVPSFQSIGEVLDLFGSSIPAARLRLEEWMRECVEPPDLEPAPSAALDALIGMVCTELGVEERHVRSGRKTRAESFARDVIIRRARHDLGLPTRVISHALGLSRQALWRRLQRDGREHAAEPIDDRTRPRG
jgi:REP element-mobilizing transposase RayT